MSVETAKDMAMRDIAGVHDHGHEHAHGLSHRALQTALVLTAVILVVEVLGGFASHSLALLSDAGHVLTDMAALGLALFAAVQAERPPNARNTYGYHRTGILAALVNAVTLILVVAFIAVEAVARLQHPEPVTGWIMALAAVVGIVMNLYIGFGLSRDHNHDNLNVRAAALHVFGDVAASAGVIIAALVIALTGWSAVDPLLSLGIALLIARGAWSILRETVDILMEAAPRSLDVAQVARDMTQQPGVVGVHDLHVWSIAGGMSALSAHVQVADGPLSACDDIVTALTTMLRDKRHITHATLQLECADCGPARNSWRCAMTPGDRRGDDHDHDAPGHTHDSQGQPEKAASQVRRT